MYIKIIYIFFTKYPPISLKVVATDASLDKIVADFIKVEDQNFALFNYVTEMNSQVESSQETIAKFRYIQFHEIFQKINSIIIMGQFHEFFLIGSILRKPKDVVTNEKDNKETNLILWNEGLRYP